MKTNYTRKLHAGAEFPNIEVEFFKWRSEKLSYTRQRHGLENGCNLSRPPLPSLH